MKFEEKLKAKYLYKKKINIFKLIYFFAQYLKTIIKPIRPNSRWGVDLILNDIFKNKKKGFYIDIGCHHPIINSHTYLLYKKGWMGINVDIDFNSIDMFNFFRPKDINKQVALSNNIKDTELYFYHNRAAKNTISREFGQDAVTVKKIRTNTLNNLIDEQKLNNQTIDFINIDVEGNELNVLKGFDLKKFKPKVILLEYIRSDMTEFYQKDIDMILNSEIYKYMIKNNYKLINWNHADLMFMLLN
jgi:FkbM family methyltransferase